MILKHRYRSWSWLLAALTLVAAALTRPLGAQRPDAANEFYDSHFHLTNYIQQGIDVREFLRIMGARVGRSTLFGIPLQQQWSHANSGDFAPTYYLHSDAPLYYYSFTDAYIASVYRSLSREDQARLDPMITGFNPADMYGVDRILDFAAETGLVAIIHNDIDMPFAKQDTEPVYLTQMKALLKRHPKTTIIWAHVGLGRIVHPVQASEEAAERNPTQVEIVESMLSDPALSHVSFDISWDEVGKYAVASPQAIARVAAMLNRYPDRVLFGTDTVAPASPAVYYAVFDMWTPVWRLLTPDASFKVRKGNYQRLFNEGRRRVRAWEQTNVR